MHLVLLNGARGLHFRFQTAMSFGIHVLQQKSGTIRTVFVNPTPSLIGNIKNVKIESKSIFVTDREGL
jgi:hypothetical protein